MYKIVLLIFAINILPMEAIAKLHCDTAKIKFMAEYYYSFFNTKSELQTQKTSEELDLDWNPNENNYQNLYIDFSNTIKSYQGKQLQFHYELINLVNKQKNILVQGKEKFWVNKKKIKIINFQKIKGSPFDWPATLSLEIKSKHKLICYKEILIRGMD